LAVQTKLWHNESTIVSNLWRIIGLKHDAHAFHTHLTMVRLMDTLHHIYQ